MRKALTRMGIAVVTMSLALIAAPGSAFAAGQSVSCTGRGCGVSLPGGSGQFPGGTISIDAKVSGGGTGSWTFRGANNYSCGGSVAADGRVHSFTCSRVPAGGVSANVFGPAGPSAIGIRW
jgi:hypothetical protein